MSSKIVLSKLCKRALASSLISKVVAPAVMRAAPSFAMVQGRAYGNTAAASYAYEETYTSDLQDLFDRMEENGPTTLGSGSMFQPPAVRYLQCGIPETALRFTTINYGSTLQAPFVHPNEHRVVMTARIDDSQLNELEQQILQEIVGARWNEEKKTLRLTSNQFGSRIENKRHLVSMLNRIVDSCRRLAKEVEDTQEAA